jgi:hypothetical protein
LKEHSALGDGAFSLDPARTTVLEGIMTSALADRATYLAALEAAVVALGDEGVALQGTSKSANVAAIL